MRFMAISAGEHVIAALVIIVRIPEIGVTTTIGGSRPSMFFGIPAELVKVSSKLSAENIV